MIREMLNSDGPRILEIFRMGIETGIATFETSLPSWLEWDGKHHGHSRFVFEDDDKVLGWVALSPVSDRSVYAGVAEVSLYIDIDYSGTGIGTALLKKVIDSSEENGIWTLFSVIFAENIASIKMNESCGFRKIGIRERIGCLQGVWKDTVIMERRSSLVGV